MLLQPVLKQLNTQVDRFQSIESELQQYIGQFVIDFRALYTILLTMISARNYGQSMSSNTFLSTPADVVLYPQS